MKWTAMAAVSAVTLAIGVSAGAAPRAKAVSERSADVLAPSPLKKLVRPPELLSPSLVTAAAAPTVDEVGDADSFGKNVTYLGMAQTQAVIVTSDCTGSDPTLERCIVANPAPGITPFNEANLGSIQLPAKATKSLICFTVTPLTQINWFNPLATPAMARFSASASITIDNDVLDDPTLLDPSTGLPFGGVLTLGLTTFNDSHTLQPGASDNKTLFMSRACIAGLVSKRALVDSYGLSEAQAKEFFKKPMTLTLGSRGSVALADASYFYGLRLYGD